MTFFEQKEQAKKDGMEVTGKTNKSDIEAFYASKVETEGKILSGEVKLIEDKTVDIEEAIAEVKEPEVKIVEVIREVEAKCKHNYVFTSIQAVRGQNPVDADGKPILDPFGKAIKGDRTYKDRFVCSNCGDVELRDCK